MKKILYKLTFILCAASVLGGCENFLERSAQDLIIPTTVAQYKELLQGEGYFKDFNDQTYFLNYMTDDVEFIDYDAGLSTNGQIEIMNYAYCWMREIENESFTDGMYAWLYSQVLVANACLDGLEEAEGTESEKRILRGQSLFQRAYAYFLLVNSYGYPYNSASVDEACMPLRLDPTPSSEIYPRESSRRIWEQVEEDIEEAIELLDGYAPVSKHEMNIYAALLLASRVKLYMGKYEESAQYAGELLRQKPELYDISSKWLAEPEYSRSSENVGFIDYDSNPEILWNFCERDNTDYYSRYAGMMFWSEDTGFRISQVEPQGGEGTLLESYLPELNKTQDDMADRRHCFFFNLGLYWGVLYPNSVYYEYGRDMLLAVYSSMPSYLYNSAVVKYDEYDSNNTLQQAFRTAEAYLNLAEAYARQAAPDTDKALYYLNELRRKRIAGYQDLTMADFTSAEELVRFIWDERRRELCFEECHRWWDLRRTTQPELKHKWIGGTVYTLEQGDEGYVLSIPQLERNFDTSIVNKRPTRVAGAL